MQAERSFIPADPRITAVGRKSTASLALGGSLGIVNAGFPAGYRRGLSLRVMQWALAVLHRGFKAFCNMPGTD